MRKHSIASVLFSALLIGQAEAQEAAAPPLLKGTCAVLADLVSSAADRFARYRGKMVAPNAYEAKIWISGFRSCSVVLAGIDMYACTRPAGSEVEARMLYQVALKKTRDCVPDWKEAAPFDAMAQGMEMIEGLRFVETVDRGEITIGIAHAREKRGQISDDSVSVVVTLRKLERPAS
jgi:hypothetical protein